MEAGEVVYQGREGTGGAQIFPVRHHASLGDYILNQQRQRANQEFQNRRLQQQMNQYRDTQIKNWEQTKFDKPSPFYGESIQKAISDYRNHGRELFNQGYDRNEVNSQSAPLRDLIDAQIQRSLNADDLYRKGKAELATQTNKDAGWTEQYLRHKLYSSDQNVDNADFEGAQGALVHPRATDFSKSVKLAADDIKGQIAMSQIDPTIKDSGLGKYMIIDNGRARFGYKDANGKMVAGITPELIQHVVDRYGEGANNELLKSVKWSIAREAVEKQLGHPLDEHMDEPAIMATYKAMNSNEMPPTQKAQINNEVKTRLYDKVRKELSQYQQEIDQTQIHSLGSYPKSGEGDTYDYSLVPGNGNELTPYSELKDDKVTGYDNPTLPLPNLAKDVVFDSTQAPGDLSGFSTDENGNPVINWVGSDNQPQTPVPYNQENIAKIRNSMKNTKAGAATVKAFDESVKKFDQALANKSQLKLDDEKLDTASSQITDLYKDGKDTEPDTFRKKLDTVLLKYGIDKKSDLYRNIGLQWAGKTPEIKIGDNDWINPVTESDKLKEQLYNANKKGFSKKVTNSQSGKVKITGF